MAQIKIIARDPIPFPPHQWNTTLEHAIKTENSREEEPALSITLP